jgi:FkbM family methyltransferase
MIPRFIRAAAERLSRNSSFEARMPARFGRRRIRLSPDSRLSVLLPGDARFEPYLLALAERFAEPGAVVWDLGACMGVFALAAADRGAGVVAFEPDPFEAGLLRRTAALNPDLDLCVVEAALCDREARVELEVAARGRAASALAGVAKITQTGGVRCRIGVAGLTLDRALELYPAPSFIKCDVEGAEALVLAGAARMLAVVRPIWAMDVASANLAAVRAAAAANDYLLGDAFEATIADRRPPVSKTNEVLLAPRETLAGGGAPGLASVRFACAPVMSQPLRPASRGPRPVPARTG